MRLPKQIPVAVRSGFGGIGEYTRLERARDYVRLDGGATTLVFACVQGGATDLVYLGARLPDGEDLAALAASQTRSVHESQPNVPALASLLPEAKAGYQGPPGIRLRDQAGSPIITDFRVENWRHSGAQLFVFYADRNNGAKITLQWGLGDEGLIECTIEFNNASDHPLILDHLAAMSIPLPRRFTEATTYSGRWAREMGEHRSPIAPDGVSKRSATGKPGFGGGNWALIHAEGSEEVIGAHLPTMTDHILTIHCDGVGTGDGRATLQMAVPQPDGGTLMPPGNRCSARAYFSIAEDRSQLARKFHAFTRRFEKLSDYEGPRKVHLNSWEALSFNLSEDALKDLASEAAALGVERFVLDDGWFGGKTKRRQNDQSSLADWDVSPEAFPNGLGPLIDHVRSLGMDFGLWVEPEMVSPDSDLYRAHPDWCLEPDPDTAPQMRGQLQLDLTNQHVIDYLYEKITSLLEDYPIAYLKWDHNRDMFPGRGTQIEQAAQYHHLVDIIGQYHGALDRPVEIEACSSGGGRIGLDLFNECYRVWPSDNNDPIERVRIIRAWSQFLPLEVLGNHVGPSPNPITGRRTSMDFRAKVAMFGHMGVEADPRAMREADRANLAAHIALYKEWRGVLHAGDLTRIDHPAPGISGLMVTHEGKSLALVAQTEFSAEFDAAPVRLTGLDPNALYRVTLPQPWPFKAALYLAHPEQWRDGITLSGQALASTGLALPLTHPETAWLIAIQKLQS